MKCQHCGSQLEADALFCPVCGKKVEQAAPENRAGGTYCPYCGAYNGADDLFCAECGQDLFDDEEENTPVSKVPMRNIIIVIIAVLVLALVGGGAYFVLNSDWGQEEEEEDKDKDEDEDEDSDSDREKSSKADDEDQEAADEVMELIDDIGTVDIDSGDAIEEAREAYDDLTDDQKDLVENYDELEEAEEEFEELQDDQEEADMVIQCIDDIGTVDADSEYDIERARNAYDKLTDDQKDLVTNYDELLEAEEEFAELKPEDEEEASSSMYVIPASNQRVLTSSDLSGLSLKELGYARNEIYARHGRMFKSQELQSYFNSKSWYSGTISPSNFSESLLSSVEKKNIELIQAEEKSRGGAYSFN